MGRIFVGDDGNLSDKTERRGTEMVFDLSDRRATGAVDVLHVIPTRLPEALRNASTYAFGQASDPLNKLDYNPFIGEEWAIVATEFQSLADKLERRFRALFDGKDTHGPQAFSGQRSPIEAAMQPTRRLSDVVVFVTSPEVIV
jgi:hypothetical protein